MNKFKPQATRNIPRGEKIICLDIGADRKNNLKLFCEKYNVAMTEMIKQMIDYCIENVDIDNVNKE